MVHAWSEKAVRDAGALLLENVEKGFSDCKAIVISGEENALQQFLERCLQENVGKSFADFYYPRLQPAEQQAFCEGLSEHEKEVLETLDTTAGEIYFPLTEENLCFFSGITARNWLFSTFYFTGRQVTVWGNYNGAYPVFGADESVISFYQNIAEECGLNTEIVI